MSIFKKFGISPSRQRMYLSKSTSIFLTEQSAEYREALRRGDVYLQEANIKFGAEKPK